MNYAPFSIHPFICFILGAAVLRLLSVVASSFFPLHARFQGLARIIISVGSTFALFGLNRVLLLRGGWTSGSLGLEMRNFPHFLLGGLQVIPIVAMMAGALWILVPFHWVQGTLTLENLCWRFGEYLAWNFGEELMFRGYALLLLQRYLGLQSVLLVISLLFGLFHLPGLFGLAAIKMICTTAIWSYIFGLRFIQTGSLWVAVGMHVCGNVLLHRVLGLFGEESLLRIGFDAPWPSGYDPGFAVSLAITLPVALDLAVSSKFRCSS